MNELPFSSSEFDPFASTGKVRGFRKAPSEPQFSEYALMDSIPDPVPSDWPRHPIHGYPLEPRTIKAQEGTKHALLGHQARIDKEDNHVPGGGPSRFTTAYCIEWGRAQGWKLLDRERFDYRTNRHRDVILGADALFESPKGIIAIQGAGISERANHRRRFEERGGTDRATMAGVGFVYLEFARGTKEPAKREWWARPFGYRESIPE